MLTNLRRRCGLGIFIITMKKFHFIKVLTILLTILLMQSEKDFREKIIQEKYLV